MDTMITMLTLWRRWMLARQAEVVRRAVSGLTPEQRRQTADQTLAEIQAAACLPIPHLHGDTQQSLYQPWSPVASRAAQRATDRSVQLRQRGIALWLAVVYHETRQARDPGLQAVHRSVLGILRELRETVKAQAPAEQAWFNAAA
ncbi:hypothetical protein [Arenimonas fontis]|uniref:Uncharacterized protein n=1 Tax=Arenimonas fontis TaxID=2608255 RepID=A0A5B2ZG55_9GAMM|nr:hypothetical protein [Arenimonas fontis]KAA2286240.1 hypothetical protein F0415_01720 [Arenimonas fontis]